MGETTFIMGGCRSGKSRHALCLAKARAGEANCFIATCVVRDAEMADRVKRHQRERGKRWQTVEAPVAVADAVSANGQSADVIIVDCLTLWISNLIMEDKTDDVIYDSVSRLCAALESVQCPVFVVSNEVGTGIVPENPMARRYRDLAGFVNQRLAACADAVIWMVAGIPVCIK